MNMRRFLPLAAVAAAAAFPASADTIYLNNGVEIDGIVKDRGDGIFEVEAGGRKVIYRASEVGSIEKNDKTGKLDMEEVRRQVAAQKQALEEETGLTEQQRDRVDELITGLRGADGGQRGKIQDTLVQLQADWGIAKYVNYLFQVSYNASLLEAAVWVSPGDAMPYLRAGVEHPNGEVRAKAIELLGRLGDRDSASLIARGLVDHIFDVKLSAIYALSEMNIRKATPAMIDMLTQPDVKLANAAREGLALMWKAELGDTPPDSATGWKEFWEAHRVADAIALEGLEPLVTPDLEFVYG
ncbi:MAG: hypothetical protein GC168_05550 [Candidatus Hydrogenedens sp.]|nr:hypothetical protein [Candidatus Hydrogenedens sp.]